MQPSASDHVYLDFELYLVFRSVTTILAAIAAAVCLKGVHAEGKSDYLKYLVRALVVLVVVEVFFDIVQWFGTYDYCEDTQMQNEMRQYVHCMPHTPVSVRFDPSSSPLECEERMAKFDLPQTLLGVASNTCSSPHLAFPLSTRTCSTIYCGMRQVLCLDCLQLREIDARDGGARARGAFAAGLREFCESAWSEYTV